MTQNGVIRLQKRVDEALTTEPAVVYDVGCTTGQATRVRLRDVVPGPFGADDISFADDYHGEDWTIDGNEVVFEALIEPDAELRTLFSVDTSDPSALTAFLAEPTVEMASGTGSGEENWGVISADLVDVTIGERTAGSGAPAAADGGDVQAAAGGVGEASVEQFIRQLDGETLTAEQSERLRTALDLESVASMDARIDHCQQQLSDLTAYVDALEAFLDEEGTGRQLVESFRSDVDAVETELDDVNEALTETTDDQADLEERVADLESAFDSLESVRDDVADLVERFETSTAEIREEVDVVRTEIEELQEWQEGVVSAFEGIQGIDDS